MADVEADLAQAEEDAAAARRARDAELRSLGVEARDQALKRGTFASADFHEHERRRTVAAADLAENEMKETTTRKRLRELLQPVSASLADVAAKTAEDIVWAAIELVQQLTPAALHPPELTPRSVLPAALGLGWRELGLESTLDIVAFVALQMTRAVSRARVRAAASAKLDWPSN